MCHTFHVLVGARILYRDCPKEQRNAIVEAVAETGVHIINTDDALYLATLHRPAWPRSNIGAIVFYPGDLQAAREKLEHILIAYDQWYDGQFGVWSFVTTEIS